MQIRLVVHDQLRIAWADVVEYVHEFLIYG